VWHERQCQTRKWASDMLSGTTTFCEGKGNRK
jgi:hypothetical protein